MAVSILDIDVKDAKFKRFVADFNKYEDALKKMPGYWAAAGATVDPLSEKLDRITRILLASLATQGKLNKEVEHAVNLFDRMGHSVEGVSSQLTKFGTIAGDVVSKTWSIATGIAKWGVGLGSSLLGFGGAGLMGIDRLAAQAAGMRFGALGMNTSAGGVLSQDVIFRRALNDPTSTINNVMMAQADYTKRWVFSSLGIGGIGNQDPAELTRMSLDRARAMFMRSDRSVQFAQSRGLLDLFSFDELNRSANIPEEEWQKMMQRQQRDAEHFKLPDAMLRKWQDLNITLDESKKSIENTFIKGLVAMTTPLEHLSRAATGLFEKFMTAVEKSGAVEKLATWLDELPDWIDSDKFQKQFDDLLTNITDFNTNVTAIAGAIADTVAWIRGIVAPPVPTGVPPELAGAYSPIPQRGKLNPRYKDIATPYFAFPPPVRTVPETPGPWTEGRIPGPPGFSEAHPWRETIISGGGSALTAAGTVFPVDPAWPSKHGLSAMMAGDVGSRKIDITNAVEDYYDLPRGMLAGIAMAESSGGTDPNAADNPFQMDENAWKTFGKGKISNFSDAAWAAGRYMQDQLLTAHGDVALAIAGYNVSPDAIFWAKRWASDAGHPEDWQKYISRYTKNTITQHYIPNVLSAMRGGASEQYTDPNLRHPPHALTRPYPILPQSLAAYNIRIDNNTAAQTNVSMEAVIY